MALIFFMRQGNPARPEKEGSRMSKVALPKWCSIVRNAPAVYEREALSLPTVQSPRDAVRMLEPHLSRQEVEEFVIICLNSQHRAIALSKITRGILNSSLVHPRETFRLAVAMGAAAIIISHNHPSGDPTPSADDRAVTDQLVAAGRILDIPVHDHIIIAGSRYTSFAEAGL
jgi:DNA repair protein RadC